MSPLAEFDVGALGLSQEDLDDLCVSADACEAPSSPADTHLQSRKSKRRICLGAIGAEIDALCGGEKSLQPPLSFTQGLSQEILDFLSVAEPSTGSRSASPLGSALKLSKRSRLSKSQRAPAAAAEVEALAAEVTAAAAAAAVPLQEGGGLSQAALDEISVVATDAAGSDEEECGMLQKRRERAFRAAAAQERACKLQVLSKSVQEAVCATTPENRGIETELDEIKTKSPESETPGSPKSPTAAQRPPLILMNCGL
mmetsp:Transcript_110814/g.196332  ORF Transcript_110814/g.196332 Transcript_110814/m.196332 type:complete len:256 (+) Transcript_110814:78-845(+)